MAELKALIFDVDGTLAETERDGHMPAFNAAFTAAGVDWHWDEPLYKKLLAIGGGRERIATYLRDYSNTAVADETALMDSIHQHKATFYTQQVAAGKVPLRAGVARLINEAKAAGIKVAVATNCSHVSLNALTQYCLGAAPDAIFDVVVTGEEVTLKKPAPEVYLKALAALGVHASEAVAIEDAEIGLRAAVAADIKAVVTISQYTAEENFTGASVVLSDLGELGATPEVIAGSLPVEHFTCVNLAALRQLVA